MTASASINAFELLHRGVQQKLWDMKWAELRPLQAEAIRAVMSSDDHLILSAATAAGKTEAAFLPILSKIADDPCGSVRAVYVGPLKALINDQFARVEDLCTRLDVPVHHWHGDVPAARKTRLVEHPGGVLLITPESLESLFVNRSAFLIKLFAGLQFIVIDELHAFLDNERGLHLRSLLFRLTALAKEPVRFIALSATLGEPSIAQEYLSPQHPKKVRLIKGEDGQKELKVRVHGYIDQAGDYEQPPHLKQMAGDLVTHCHGAANLIFANAKSQVEELADECAKIGVERGVADRFLVHHGSLSAEIRHDAERALKSGAMATAFCSSTLEMGIDIGSVRMIGQVGPPWSVASLKQRVGRSGRRGDEPRILRTYIACDEVDAKSSLFDRLHLELIQSIAVTELLLVGWVEPPAPARCDLSTLTQQIISMIAQHGGAQADLLYQRLCEEGAFQSIEKPLFVRLLRQLAAKDVIEQMPEGDLILGLLGERLRKDKGFYAVFQTPEELVVLNDGQRIGSVTAAVQPGEYLLLAGRRWQVTLIDSEALVMYVKPAQGWKPPTFAGAFGAIHPRIRQEMRKVLSDTKPYAYLDTVSASLLEQARRDATMSGAVTKTLVPLGPQKTALMTWAGSRITDTLSAMFATIVTAPVDQRIALVFDLVPAEVRDAMTSLTKSPPHPVMLAGLLHNVTRRKYDWLLGDDLSNLCTTRDWLDVPGAVEMLNAITPSVL